MRVQTEEWRRFIPGSRMYKGKKTLFYNGEKLYDFENEEFLIYNEQEQESWQVIIVLPGVEVIPESTFADCFHIETVIMSDTVRRIEGQAFENCYSLVYIRLSTNLEYIGEMVFYCCESLPSIFIPPSCTEIGAEAFAHCEKLIIFHVPQHTRLAERVIYCTPIMDVSPIEAPTEIERIWNSPEGAEYFNAVNVFVKNHHRHGDLLFLHQACSSYYPTEEIIYDIIKRQGLKAFQVRDSFGVTPSEYLSHNPYTDIDEKVIMKRYILDMMGEIVS